LVADPGGFFGDTGRRFQFRFERLADALGRRRTDAAGATAPFGRRRFAPRLALRRTGAVAARVLPRISIFKKLQKPDPLHPLVDGVATQWMMQKERIQGLPNQWVVTPLEWLTRKQIFP